MCFASGKILGPGLVSCIEATSTLAQMEEQGTEAAHWIFFDRGQSAIKHAQRNSGRLIKQLFFTYLIIGTYCKRFAQSAGPWFGHRFAQSAGPRSPLRSVRCAMEICCISQPLCYPFALLCEFRTLFETVFRSLGSLLEDMGNTFTI